MSVDVSALMTLPATPQTEARKSSATDVDYQSFLKLLVAQIQPMMPRVMSSIYVPTLWQISSATRRARASVPSTLSRSPARPLLPMS